MSAFDHWLAGEATARERAGLTRRLTDSDREPLLDLADSAARFLP